MKLGRDRKIKGSPCLLCREDLTGATCVGQDAGPRPGDLTICIYCGHPMAFDAELKLRNLTEEERRAIAADPRARIVQFARGQMRKH